MEYLARVFAGRDIQFDSRVSSSYFCNLVVQHAFALFRGLACGYFKLFKFSNVVLLEKRKILIGRDVVIRKHTTLDAMGESGITIGDNSSIGSFCIMKVSGSPAVLGRGIWLGRNVGIGDFCHIGGSGGVWIGDGTISGSYLSIHPENHNFSDGEVEIRKQGVSRKGVRIGSNCWLGAKVTVLDGVVIGDGCVVAAGAVVLEGVYEKNSVLAGVPARVLKKRFDFL